MARTAYSPGRAVRKPMYKKRKLIVKPGFLLVAAFVCYFNMGNILYPVAAAVAVHEAGHYIGMKALSVKVERVVLGCAGPAFIYSSGTVPYKKEIIIAAAGPAAGLLLSLAAAAAGKNWNNVWDMYYLSGVSLSLSLFNLLPALPLDGGRIAKAIVMSRFDVIKGERIMGALNMAVVCILLIAGIYIFAVTKRNFTLLVVALWLFWLYTVGYKKEE